MYVYIHIWHNKRKSACERIRQITFFRVSRVTKQWTGIFKVSDTCMNLCNNMVEEKAGLEKQNSKKRFEKNKHACIVEGVLGFLIFLPVWYLKVAGPTRKFKAYQSSNSSESDKQKSWTRRWGSLA